MQSHHLARGCMLHLWLWDSVASYDGGGRSYPAGAGGLSEVLLFRGLRSLRLQSDDPPEPLYLAEGFSELTALTAVELRLHQEQIDDYPRPTFSTLPCPHHCGFPHLLLVSAIVSGKLGVVLRC